MGNQKEKVNIFGNPSSFFQVLIRELLKNRLKGVEPSWLREVNYKLDESGRINQVFVGIEIPIGTRTPFQLENGTIITKFENGKAERHKIFIQIKI